MRPKMRTTAILVFHKVGHILLQKRDNIPTIQEPGRGDVWGGHCTAGEMPAACAIRELREESRNGLRRKKLRARCLGLLCSICGGIMRRGAHGIKNPLPVRPLWGGYHSTRAAWTEAHTARLQARLWVTMAFNHLCIPR
jgi:hypothetical protein